MNSQTSQIIGNLVISCVLLSIVAALSAEEPKKNPVLSELPDDARATLTNLFSQVNNVDTSNVTQELKPSYERFKEVLGRLGKQVDAEHTKKVEKIGRYEELRTQIKLKLLQMARYYAKHRGRYKEVIDRYGNPKAFFAHKAKLPDLKKKHIGGNYRLAWELVLIYPDPETYVYTRRRAFEALTQIQNNESIVVFVYAFSRLAREEIHQGGNVVNRQKQIISALLDFPGKQGVDAILKCLSLSDDVGGPINKNESLYKVVASKLKYAIDGHPEYRNAWHAAVKEYPREDLPDKQERLLKKLIKVTE